VNSSNTGTEPRLAGPDGESRLQTDPRRFYEALGRVMAAIRECHALDGAHHLDWWFGAGGRTWEIEWRDGPYPSEVAQTLIDHATRTDDHSGVALRGIVNRGAPGIHAGRAFLTVLDVPVTLRALEPIGADAVIQQMRHMFTDAE
jgi:hypothetical protein